MINGNRNFTAHEILDTAGALLGERGKEYDSVKGERSAPRIAAAYNAIKGARILEAGDVYLILALTKAVRQETAAGYHVDSGDDLVAYCALSAEMMAEDHRRMKQGEPSLAASVCKQKHIGPIVNVTNNTDSTVRVSEGPSPDELRLAVDARKKGQDI